MARIVIISQYFPPENFAASSRIEFFARWLAHRGHSVYVICETPNYPNGIIKKGYKNRFTRTEQDGYEILRVPVWISRKKSFLHRLLSYFSFTLSAISATRTIYIDIVIATSPPFGTLVVGLFLKLQRKSINFFLDIRDVWPDAALSVGFIKKKGLLFKCFEYIESLSYLKARGIIVNSEPIGDLLVTKKRVPRDKITFIPNGFEDKQVLVEKIITDNNKFTVLYSGLIGLAQDFEIIINAAHILRDKNDIEFVIAGDGPIKTLLETRICDLKLPNIRFIEEVPRNDMFILYGRASIGLVTLKNDELLTNVIPSKVFDYMGNKLPIIITNNSQGAHIIGRADCGISIHNSEQLAQSIILLKENPNLRQKMALNGYEFVKKHYSRDTHIEKLGHILNECQKGIASS